jgi:hypothetical protein
VIKNIPLSPFLPKDRLIWSGTNNVIFTVRCAYDMEVERRSLAKEEYDPPFTGVDGRPEGFGRISEGECLP